MKRTIITKKGMGAVSGEYRKRGSIHGITGRAGCDFATTKMKYG